MPTTSRFGNEPSHGRVSEPAFSRSKGWKSGTIVINDSEPMTGNVYELDNPTYPLSGNSLSVPIVDYLVVIELQLTVPEAPGETSDPSGGGVAAHPFSSPPIRPVSPDLVRVTVRRGGDRLPPLSHTARHRRGVRSRLCG